MTITTKTKMINDNVVVVVDNDGDEDDDNGDDDAYLRLDYRVVLR